jgi:hypothetical protein
MENNHRGAIIQACRALLKPLAGFLLKCGMTWREFAEISKSVFVQVASDEFGIKGRQTNISRVSILTGISRKEVSRQRTMLKEDQTILPSKTTDATRVLSGWHQDPEFLGPGGRPKALTLEGAGTTFKTLCRRYGGDIPASAMLKELKRVQAVSESTDGRLNAILRYYMPTQFDAQWLLNAGSIFEDLGNNINHNLTADQNTPSHFLGRATDNAIDAKAVSDFRKFVEHEGQQFLERVDDWLAQHRVHGTGSKGKEPVRLGVGLFLVNDELK